MSVKKSSVAFDPIVWNQLSSKPNRSLIVNEALKLYFMLEQKEAEATAAWEDHKSELIIEWKHFRETGENYSPAETFNRKF